MCPQQKTDAVSPDSDCSIDMERLALTDVQGYNNLSEKAPEPLRLFAKKVASSDVQVGDCDNKTKLTSRISGGSFGEVYRGEFVNDNNRQVAVKVEPQGNSSTSFLLQEGTVYRNLEGGPGIPNIYWYGYYGSEYSALVMDLLGPTLYHHFHNCHGKLSLKTMLMLTDQMIATLQHIHSQGYVHRDISPSNFVLGAEGNESKLFLIDFGHAKRFNASPTLFGRRTSVKMPRAVVGTPRFISIHAHSSRQDAPRDDLEALGYMLAYLAVGSLPWQGVQACSMPEKLNKIAEIKMNTPVEDICKGLPEEFSVFIKYARGLKLYEMPDYDGIRIMFKALATKLDIKYDDAFDWITTDADFNKTCPIKILEEESDDTNSPNISPVSR